MGWFSQPRDLPSCPEKGLHRVTLTPSVLESATAKDELTTQRDKLLLPLPSSPINATLHIQCRLLSSKNCFVAATPFIVTSNEGHLSPVQPSTNSSF